MSRSKAVFAVLILAAIVEVVPAHAAPPLVRVMIAGSSAMWQAQALAAYNGSKCVSGTAPCRHYTGANFNLTDTRPTLLGGTSVTDKGNIWIVWDHAAPVHVWAFIKVDSVVGTRCYFAQPRCNVNISPFPAPANAIATAVWGDGSSDTVPPAAVTALFTGASGLFVNAAATDIRPEDGIVAQCRANSVIGGGKDGLDGLGYGTNGSGVCPTFGAPVGQLDGSDIVSGIPGSTATAHAIAFNISGTDPFSNTAIPASTTVSVGAAPVIFITSRSGALASVTNASDAQLKTVFSGTTCNASALGAAAGAIQAYLREPLSGTMNTTEYTVFRYPNHNGTSQEKGVGGAKLSNSPCSAGGGGRTRGIGTGEVVAGVHNSVANFGMDGIAYAFFSYGNVSSIANSSSFGYLTLDGVDGIFASYAGGDPGEPGNGTIPGAANLPASCQPGGFPCPESQIWTGGRSFPHLRDGTYRAWSVLRLVSNGTALGFVRTLVAKSNLYAVQSTPDYVPFAKVLSGTTTLDPGLARQRSHYGPGAHNVNPEKGRDVGGCIQAKGGAVINRVQNAPGGVCGAFVPD